jgi:hypothetical protein
MSTEISSLAGEIVAFTYPSLIKVADNGFMPTEQGGDRNTNVVFNNGNKTGAPRALSRLSDGNGNIGSIAIGQTDAGAKVFGPLIVDGSSNCTIGQVLEVQSGGVCIEKQICACGVGANHLCGLTNTLSSNVAASLVVADSICQTSHAGSIQLEGDLCVGIDAADRDFSVDSATGNTIIKGTANIGDDCTTSTITLTNKGILLNKGIIYGCNDIVAFHSSDKRLKNNIEKIEDSNNIITNINGYEFDWNEKSQREGHDYGVIAQELEKVAPELVKKRDDGYLSVDYIKLIPVLIEEVKSLNNRIKVLEEK